MEDAFVRSLLTDAVLLRPQDLGGNFAEMVVAELRRSLEGVCSRHGYIMPGSIAVHELAMGRLEAAMLNGNVRFDVQFFASVCDPQRGMVVSARVVNANRFGILAHAGLTDAAGAFTPVIEAIITKQADVLPAVPGALAGAEELDALKQGDEVVVQVLGKRAQLRAHCISVVGIILRDRTAAAAAAREAAREAARALPPVRRSAAAAPRPRTLADVAAVGRVTGAWADDEDEDDAEADAAAEAAADEERRAGAGPDADAADADADAGADASEEEEEEEDEEEDEDEDDVMSTDARKAVPAQGGGGGAVEDDEAAASGADEEEDAFEEDDDGMDTDLD